jgi:hypothetical protein
VIKVSYVSDQGVILQCLGISDSYLTVRALVMNQHVPFSILRSGSLSKKKSYDPGFSGFFCFFIVYLFFSFHFSLFSFYSFLFYKIRAFSNLNIFPNLVFLMRTFLHLNISFSNLNIFNPNIFQLWTNFYFEHFLYEVFRIKFIF